MRTPLDPLLNLFGGRPRKRPSPTEEVSGSGTAVYGGYPEIRERDRRMASREQRNRTYSDILCNTSIVAAGVRYFLNLSAKARWTFDPAESDEGGMYADMAERMLTHDPERSWGKIVRRAAMFRFWGFGIQEWTMRRADDGSLTFMDISPVAQRTIERWDVDYNGRVMGMTQCVPQDGREVYLPRDKVMYLVDEALDDGPEGLGLFRHLVEPATRLKRYEELEGVGYENDLRGIPIARAPLMEMIALLRDGEITDEEFARLLEPMNRFLKDHIKNPSLGMLLDSSVYESQDDAARPSTTPRWAIDLLSGTASSFEANAAAIERLNRELARILGVEQLLLGESSSGSYALSRDKTNALFLTVEATLEDIQDVVRKDLLAPLWRYNGWPADKMPEPRVGAVRFADIEAIGQTLRDMATAGAVLHSEDPVISEVREIMGLSAPPPDMTVQGVLEGMTDGSPEGGAE